MIYNSEFRDFFSFSSTFAGQKYMDTIMRELLLPYGLDPEDFSKISLKDHLLLTTYSLTAVSAPLCAILLPFHSIVEIKSVLSRAAKAGFFCKHSVSFYASESPLLSDVRLLYSISEKGEQYLCRKFDLPNLQTWEHTNSVRCLHDYQTTLTTLQLLLQRIIDAERHRGRSYIPLWKAGSDHFMKEYMLDKQSYQTNRREEMKTHRNLIADAVYELSDNDYTDKAYYEDNYSRTYYMAPFYSLILDDQRTAQLPLHIFVETDMRTERNPVIIEKLAHYAEAQTISRNGAYSYRDSCILFSCYDFPPVPTASWLITNKALHDLVGRAQATADGGEPISRDNLLDKITDLPESVQNGYREINEFYGRGRDCKTAIQLLNRYQTDKANIRLPMLAQYKSDFQARRCRLRLSQVYQKLYLDVNQRNMASGKRISYVSGQADCCKVIRELLEGLHCYFLPSSTIWQSASRMYHNPDFLAWVIATYYANIYAVLADIKSRLNAPENGVKVLMSTYEQMPQFKVPTDNEELWIQFPQCLTFKRNDSDTDQYTFVFEDLSDLGAWVRLTEYFRQYPDGTKDIRIVCLYESDEEVKLFSKATGISGLAKKDLIQSPAGIAYVSIRGYHALKNPTLENWLAMDDEEKEAWVQKIHSYRLYAYATTEGGIIFQDGNHLEP